MIFKNTILSVCLFFTSAVAIVAQEVTFQTAYDLFGSKKFDEAASQFAKLTAKSERDPKLNYYYGASLTEANRNIAEAVKRLKFAQVNKYGNDLSFYQGRASQINYEFDQALEFFARYQKFGKNKELLERSRIYMAQCEASKALSSKIFDIKVVGSTKTTIDNLLPFYNLSKDAGSILKNSDFFDSGVDPDDVLYRTERGDAIYFSMTGGNGHKDIYRMEKLIDGWGEETAIDELNSTGDDIMPFMMTDGNTIYFSSNRDGGMGGFDIYKSTYDPEIRQFSEPLNIGVPFNSPFDDMLFVGDDFKNKAWFASNRNVAADSVEVFEIVWDNSVVRNFAMNTGEIKKAAMLQPDVELARQQAGIKQHFTSDKRIAKTAEIFRFVVNDTLTYTDWSHFRNEEAEQEFRNGYNLMQKKDSLSAVMAGYRRVFSTTNDENERNNAVNSILKMERDVYSLDEQIDRHQIKARMLEIGSLKENKTPASPGVKSPAIQNAPAGNDLDKILIPSNFTYYTDVEFERQINEWNLMYSRLFDGFDIAELQSADSLYVWGNILTLEASKLNEQLLKHSVSTNQVSIIKGSSSDEEVELIRSKAKEYKLLALRLYHKSLDTKSRLFEDKINEIKINDEGLNLPEFTDKQAEAAVFLKKAKEQETMAGSSLEIYEKAGTLKRQAVYSLNDALFLYLGFIDGSVPAPKADVRKNTTKSEDTRVEQAPQQPKNIAVEEKKEAIVIDTPRKPAVTEGKPEYRIQLGVFRNQPNGNALSKLSDIQSVQLGPNQGSKYYSGRFAKYDEALKHVGEARSAGFEGAFVVAFLNGEQITVAKAKELE